MSVLTGWRVATSATPLREALNRLVSDGLVERRKRRGFVVAGISAQGSALVCGGMRELACLGAGPCRGGLKAAVDLRLARRH